MIQIEIDNGSGFCFGVTTAIKKAEEELRLGASLYCLGDIVHNGMEVERLHEQGLITINHDDLQQLHGAKVLLRAHGEPPSTYQLAQGNNIEIIDAPWCCNCSDASSGSTTATLMHRLSSSARTDMPRCWVLWDRRKGTPSL